MSTNWRYLAAGLILIGAWGLAYAMRPVPVMDVRDIDLEREIPRTLGNWTELRTGLVQIDLAPRNEDGSQEATLQYPYDQTLTRTYVRQDGQVVMLALAWGSKQRQEIKIHRPEGCYAGQGFHVVEKTSSPLSLSEGATVMTTRLVTRSQSRTELVTYWIRIGQVIISNAWQSRLKILDEGLRGKIPDGILVRVSQSVPPNASTESSYEIQAEFLKTMYANLNSSGKHILVGGPR